MPVSIDVNGPVCAVEVDPDAAAVGDPQDPDTRDPIAPAPVSIG